MTYETLPERLRDLIPSSEGQDLFRAALNRQIAARKTEEVAFASAWAELEGAGYAKGKDGKWMRKTQPTAAQVHVDGTEWDDEDRARYKRMMNDDTFTTSAEAAVRSMDLGLDGAVHVHQTADGQAVYMPGDSHAAYLERMADIAGVGDSVRRDAPGAPESSPDLLQRMISAILRATMEHDLNKSADILKVDTARRIVWGWASVSTMKGELVTDRQGDRIAPAEMEKMADRFMRSARAAKAMHDGDDVGEVVHSFPLTKELAAAFGIQTDREGWITGTYIKSDAEWQKVLDGEYKGLSIGGRAKRRIA
jgi:cation transport regulator ChaB